MRINEVSFLRRIIEEKLLISVFLGAFFTSIWLRRFPKYSLSDLKVIYSLFVFLLILKGLERSNFFYYIAERLKAAGSFLGIKLIFLTALLAIFVTNDVALLIVVPLTLALEIKDRAILVILETITANAASAFTPFGNPQNMFIYYHYHLSAFNFLKVISPFVLFSLSLVLIVGLVKARGKFLSLERNNVKLNKINCFVYLSLSVLFILAILKILPLTIGLAALVYVLFLDRRSFAIDYFLLATFFVFFGFTDNLIQIFNFKLSNSQVVFPTSVLLSQLISNVPATLFLADFTSNWQALLWGVSVGGFGNVVGSLASLISYKFYKSKFPQAKFLLRFHLYNFAFLFLGVVFYFLIRSR